MSVRLLRAALGLTAGLGLLAGAVSPAAAETGPARLAVVVPVIVPAEDDGLLSAQTLAGYTAPNGLLNRQLDAVAGHPVTLGIDPRIIVSIRLLGATAPVSAQLWLQRLAAMPQESFALPFANADTTLATQAGNSELPAIGSLAFAIEPERFDPDPADGQADTLVPGTEVLLSWPYRITGLHWPVEGRVVGADLAVIAAEHDTVLLSSANVEQAGPLVELGQLRALVADDRLSRSLRMAASAGSTAEWTSAVEGLVAHAAGMEQSIATLDRAVAASTVRLQQTLAALAAEPGIRLVPLSALGAGAAEPAELIDLPHDPDRIEAARVLLGLDAQVHRFAEIVPEPALISGPRRLALLAALDADRTGPAGIAAAERAAEQSRELLSAVQVVASSDVNFFTDRSSIQVPVRNDLDQAVTVFLTVSPDRPLLSVENRMVELSLEPHSVVSAPVAVQSISNGTVSLTMTLRGPDGISIGTPARIAVNVQAGWEGPIVGVIAVLLALVFVGGLARNIVRRRRERAEAASG